MIAIARERMPSVDFRAGDIEFLPYEDDAFDVVFAANSVQYSADRVATLRGFARVCCPEGRIVAGLFGPPERVAHRAISKAVRDVLPEPPAGGGPFELSRPGMLEGLFEDAGLEIVETGDVDCPSRYPDFATFWRGASSAGPWQRAIEVVGKERLMTSIQAAVEPFMLDDGSIEIGPNVFTYVVAST